MKKVIAMFKDEKYGLETTRDFNDLEAAARYQNEDLVRISDWVAVDFPELGREQVVAGQIRVIRHIREKTVEQFSAALALLDDREAKLLALTSNGGKP